MNLAASPLVADLHLLNMIHANLAHEETEAAVFRFFVRKLPPQRALRMAAGLEQVLDFPRNLRSSAEELAWLARGGRFGKHLLDHLARMCFTGDVHTLPEGTVFLANPPNIVAHRAPIDGLGVGTSLATSFDVPTLDCAYNLQKCPGLPPRKRSMRKATPGCKQVWRQYTRAGRARDRACHGEERRLTPQPTLAPARLTTWSGYPSLCDGWSPAPSSRWRSRTPKQLAAEVGHRLAYQERMQA